jgi:hypothetical protein
VRIGTVKGSSLIKKIGFSGSPGSIGTLRIEFYDTTLDFLKVSYSIFAGLVKSKDKSDFYFKNIYGVFRYREV